MFGFGERQGQHWGFVNYLQGPFAMNLAGQLICPHCGLNLSAQHPAYNIYPHLTGACKQEMQAKTQDDDADFLRQMGIKP